MPGSTPRKTVIVATWGYPPSWRQVEYSVNAPSLGVVWGSLRAKTTLDPLIRALKSRGFEVEKLVILAPDTLDVKSVSSVQDYVHLVEVNTSFVVDWVKNETSEVREHLDRTIIEIVPNIGVYTSAGLTCRWEYGRGLRPSDAFQAISVRRVLEALLDVLVEEDAVTLILDTSHGINFMPTLTLQVVRDAALVASVSMRARVDLVIVNSEPVVGQTQQATIHEVGVEVYRYPSTAVEVAMQLPQLATRGEQVRVRVVEAAVELRKVLQKTLESSVNKAAEEAIREGLVAASIYLYSMPLALAYHALDSNYDLPDAFEILERSIDYFRGFTLVEAHGGTCRVLHQVGLNYDSVRALLYAVALNRMLKSIYTRVLWEPVGYLLETLHDRGVYLEELKELKEVMKSPNTFFVDREIGRLLKPVAEGCTCGPQPGKPSCVSKIEVPAYCIDWPGEPCDENRIDFRNLAAHAGLEINSIEASIDEYGLAIRYRDGCWDAVKKRLEKLALELARG